MHFQGGLGVSTHSKSLSARVHLSYYQSDKYVFKVAYVFQLIVSLHQLEYTVIIAYVINTLLKCVRCFNS